MLVVLCLAAVAAAQATPVAKIVPVFEDIASLRIPSDPRIALRTWCIDDCHHHVLHKPVFVVHRSLQGTHTLHFAPTGLNGLGKSPLTTPLQEALLSPEPKVAAIFPFARFPFELFPGLVDTELVIPEHADKLSTFYKEAPIIAFFPEEEFHKINEKRGLIQVADLSTDAQGFTVAKDHALLNRNAALDFSRLTPGRYEVSPAVTPGIAQPAASPFQGVPTKANVIPPAPVTGGFAQFGGSGIGVGGETVRFIPNTPAATSYYTPLSIL